MRTVSRRLLLISIPSILVLVFLSWLVTSQSGLRWLVDIAKPYLPIEIKLGEIHGSLADSIAISQFSWHSDDFELELKNTQLNCDWLAFFRDNYQCQSLMSEQLIVKTRSSEVTTDPISQIERLSPIKSLLRAGVGELKIDQIIWQIEDKGDIEEKVVIRNFRISGLSWAKNKLKWLQANADGEQFSVALKGAITPLKNWSLQLEATISLNNYQLEIIGSGDIFSESRWTINSTGQISSSTKANVDFHNGKPKIDAVLDAPAQDLSWVYPDLSLKNARVAIILDWLSADFDIDSKIVTAGNDFELRNKVIVDNILDWQSKTQGDLLVSTQLSAEVINDYLLSFLPNDSHSLLINNKSSFEAISTALTSSYELTDGHFYADTKLELGKILLSKAKLKLDINDNDYQNLAIAGQLSIPETPDKLNLKIKQLASEFSIQQDSPGNKIKYSLTGSAAKLEHQLGSLGQVSWQVKYEDQIKAKLSVTDANAIINSHNIPFRQTEFTLDGTQAKHLVALNSTINDINSSLTLEGAIPDLDNQLWKANNLKLLLKRGQRLFDITLADLTIFDDGMQLNNLCFNDNGVVCGSFKQTAEKLNLTGNINNFSVTEFKYWSDELGIELPIDVMGSISGDVSLKLMANQVQTMDVALSSPNLTIKTAQADLTFEGLNIKSTQALDDISVDVLWRHFRADSIVEQRQLSLDSPNGNIRADLNKLEDIKINLLMQDNSLTLATTNMPEDTVSNDATASDTSVIKVPKLNVTSRYTGQSVRIKSLIQLLGDDHIDLGLVATWPLNTQSQIEGDLSISLTQFNWLKRWQSRIDDIDMSWQQTNHISGAIDDLAITGAGKVHINKFVMQELGLEVTDSFLNINSINNLLALDGRLKNKQGEVSFNGELTLWPNIEMTANLVGDNLTVIDSAEQKLVVSPKLFADYREEHLKVTGDVVFNQANISINKLPRPKIDVSNDEVFLGSQQDKDKTFSYDISLNLETSDDVAFQAFGLSSKIVGRLKLLAQKGKTININGELQLIDGQFEAYKQALTIEQGQLIFLGAANNPGIQFTATRTIDDIKVGVAADGTLLQPRLTLTSVPAMPEENILALLLTGRSIESLTVSEGNALANAAINIGINGANRIAQKVADSLGIQNIEITAKNTATSSTLNIATQINDRLTAGYGTTIDSQNETQSGWIIEYRLSPKLSVEAISGREVSANITYKNQFDSDKAKISLPEKEEQQ